MKKILFVLTCLMVSAAMMASITVTGTVISAEDGLPVIGASVLEKGTSNGTITDFDGMYELTVADDAVLVYSYVGLTSQELKVSGSVMNVTLKGDAIAMEEVVVTAMGVVQAFFLLNNTHRCYYDLFHCNGITLESDIHHTARNFQLLRRQADITKYQNSVIIYCQFIHTIKIGNRTVRCSFLYHGCTNNWQTILC